MLPHDFPPRETVYQQTQRWLRAGCFQAMVLDLRELLRLASGCAPEPSAAILDSPPWSGPGVGAAGRLLGGGAR